MHTSKNCCNFATLLPLMNTNAHILTLTELLCEVKFSMREWPDNEAKQKILSLIDQSQDELMQVNTELSNRMHQIEDMTEHLTSFSKALYAPIINAQFIYPEEGDYNGVREYVKQRKEKDEVFKNYCMNHSRKQLCTRLSEEFGWELDVKSYARNVQRH